MKDRIAGWPWKAMAFWGAAAAVLGQTVTRAWTQDESTYLLTAKLIREERLLPYLDLSYRQTPLYPYLLSLWGMLVGNELVLHRLISFLSILGIAELLRRTGKWGWVAGLGFLLGPFTWEYFVLVKPYAFPTLAVLLAWHLARRGNFLLAGACAGVAGSVRLVYFVPGLLALLWFKRNELVRWKLGLFLGLLPTFLFAIWDWDRFLFNVFGSHFSRSGTAEGIQLSPVFRQLLQTGLEPANGLLILAWVLVGVGSLYRWKALSQENIRNFGAGTLAALLVVLPTVLLRPFYDEYVGAGFVFLWFAVAGMSVEISSRLRRGMLVLASVAIAFSAYRAVEGFRRLGEIPSANSIQEVRRVGQRIAERTSPQEQILSFWSGYPLVAHRRVPRGLETGLTVVEMAGKLTEEESRRFHILRPEDIARMIDRKEVPWVVIGLASPPGLEERVAHSYRLVEDWGSARLYGR